MGLAHTHHCPAGRSEAPSPAFEHMDFAWGGRQRWCKDGAGSPLSLPLCPWAGGAGSRPAEGWEGGPGPCRPWQGGFLPALIGGTWLSAAGSECQRSDFVAGL